MEKQLTRQRLSQKRHPERHVARTMVQHAVKRGRLPHPTTLPCSHCGGPADEYHHTQGYAPEYRYCVEAICKRCHATIPKSPRTKRSEGRSVDLTMAQAGEIGRRGMAGESGDALALEFRVPVSLITAIIGGQRWATKAAQLQATHVQEVSA